MEMRSLLIAQDHAMEIALHLMPELIFLLLMWTLQIQGECEQLYVLSFLRIMRLYY